MSECMIFANTSKNWQDKLLEAAIAGNVRRVLHLMGVEWEERDIEWVDIDWMRGDSDTAIVVRVEGSDQ